MGGALGGWMRLYEQMSDSIFNRPRRQTEPRMTDGRDFGDQSHTPDQGAAGRRDPGADALSELARLISDPLAPIPGRPGDVPNGRLADVARAASSPSAAARDPLGRPQDRPREGRSYEDRSHEDRSHDDRSSENWSRRSSLDRGVRRDPDFSRPRTPVQATEADTDHSETPHGSDSYDFLQLPDRDDYAVAPRQASADEEDYGLGDSRDSSRRHTAYGRQHEEYADEYSDEYAQDADGGYEAEHDNPDDGESGAKRHRSTAKVAIAVLGLAVFGSAAAFGYRAIFKAAPSGPTPIIRADNSPTKVTPVGTEANARPVTGPFGDRLGEQLVRRDEEPVDVGSTYRTGAVDAGRAAFPPPEIVPATAGPAQSGDPKRVRTVPIRVDQSAPSDRSAPRAAPSPQSQPALPSPSRQAAASPPPSYPAPLAGEGRVGGGVPVATAPDAATSRAIEAGGFVVQVSAQRSEAEAQAAFRTLQAKYSMLSGREPLIRRKDLGEKGIFFAAQIGPFGVKSDADQLCETLRAAGGACFVQKN